MKGAHKNENIITYEKGIAVKEKISKQSFVKKDLMGFGTAVGSFSNTATILYSMIGIFGKPEQEEQRKELKLRIKLLREYVGQEIDRAKLGIKQQKLPDSWKKFKKVNEDDTDDVKAEKYKHNSMVINKKPYFFRYLYPELNKEFKQYENSYNVLSKDMFGIKLKKLLIKQDKTDAEKTLIRKYQKYSPLIVSNCIMNTLCKEIERVDFDIKFGKNNICLLPKCDNLGFVVNKENLSKFRQAYRKYNNKKSIQIFDTENKDEEELMNVYFGIMDVIKEETRSEIDELNLSPEENLFYIWKLSEEYNNFNWNFAWDIIPEDILYCIPQGKTVAPIRNEFGKEYLGENYILKDVSKKEEGGEIYEYTL